MRASLGATAAAAARSALRGTESIAGGPSRRTYGTKTSEVYKWKPGLKRVPPPRSDRDRPRGLRSLPIPQPKETVEAQRVHFPKKWNQQTTAVSEFGGGVTVRV